MKHSIKLLSFILSAFLVLSVLAACGAANEQPSTVQSQTETASTKTPVNTTEASVPTTETPVTDTETTVTTSPEPSTVPTPVTTTTPTVTPEPATKTITLSRDVLYDKMVGGWIGQMVGVAWGASTEFCWAGKLIPESAIPAWRSNMINDAFDQDDLYVEIPFLDVMKKSGIDCDPSLIAKAFSKTTFALWHANGMGKTNLLNGISYPDSGSYLYNYHCEDIDWQIECDFLGMMYPGLVSASALRAFELGHIMNYGDGVYGGSFITAMHAAAYTAESIDEICRAGISVIPEGTEFRTLIDEVYANYKAGDSFETNWKKIQNKWGNIDICPELQGVSNIDAKLNSGYVLMGLLYGEGDFAKTIIISTRCGQDSDCNPSSAASILGSFYGASALAEEYTSALDRNSRKFSTTKYTFNQTIDLNFSLMEEVLEKAGAVKDEDGNYTYVIDIDHTTVPFEQTPDGVYVYTVMKLSANILRFNEVTPFGKNEKVTGYIIETGDGVTFKDVTPFSYTYNTAGTYTVKITVYGDKGTVNTKEQTFTVKNDAASPDTAPYAICSVTLPTGGGSKDIRVISDGYVPKNGDPDARQYDTYILGDPHGNPDRFAYIGYVYREKTTVSTVVFTEGDHFGNGGWFKNGQICIEALIDGEWVKIETTLDNPYPVGDDKAVFGNPFETYTFTLNTPVECDGIRLAGLAGGSATFISVGELQIL